MAHPETRHTLDQGSGTARFADHQDTEEEVAVGARARDRRVVYTAVIALSDGGDTAMRILGHEELAFTGEAGSGVAFRSELWHRTERASEGVWKLALFLWVPAVRTTACHAGRSPVIGCFHSSAANAAGERCACGPQLRLVAHGRRASPHPPPTDEALPGHLPRHGPLHCIRHAPACHSEAHSVAW